MKWDRLFFYDGKNLVWRHRPRGDFKTAAAWANTNSRFEGKVAGRLNCSKSGATYIQVRIHGKIKLAHRIIWEMHFGEIPRDLFIDHIDGDGTNNRLDNLRIVDRSGNARNSPLSRKNTSGRIGVYFINSCNKWGANIYENGQQVYLGSFSSFSAACRARAEAEVRCSYHVNHGRAGYA